MTSSKVYIDKPAKILSIEEQPIPNVVIIKSNLLKAYDYKIGNTTTKDLGYSSLGCSFIRI